MILRSHLLVVLPLLFAATAAAAPAERISFESSVLGEMRPDGFRWLHVEVEGGEHVPVEGYTEGLGFLLGGPPTSETPRSR